MQLKHSNQFFLDTGSCLLYLWRNGNTVVIGRNQTCWKEGRVKEIEAEGGFLARRLSGGGAVYHDEGNLNFTFVMKRRDYDLERQTEVILQGVSLLGIMAERTGRNDLTVGGRKFSGNAFYSTGKVHYHHGTILLSSNMSKYSDMEEPTRVQLSTNKGDI
ncbi:MAG: hypothetical protein HGA25_08620 [Clostridiales bacterium]|nr:hypothetical protein [Clostridiales bacterium]